MCGKKQSGYVQVRREWTDDIYDKLKICTRVKLLCRRQKQMKQDNYWLIRALGSMLVMICTLYDLVVPFHVAYVWNGVRRLRLRALQSAIISEAWRRWAEPAGHVTHWRAPWLEWTAVVWPISGECARVSRKCSAEVCNVSWRAVLNQVTNCWFVYDIVVHRSNSVYSWYCEQWPQRSLWQIQTLPWTLISRRCFRTHFGCRKMRRIRFRVVNLRRWIKTTFMTTLAAHPLIQFPTTPRTALTSPKLEPVISRRRRGGTETMIRLSQWVHRKWTRWVRQRMVGYTTLLFQIFEAEGLQGEQTRIRLYRGLGWPSRRTTGVGVPAARG